MPRLGDHYRKYAEDCRKQAEMSISGLDKERWLQIAEEWLKLADSEDRSRRRDD